MRTHVEILRKRYPVGARIRLIFMEDKQAPKPGTLGTINGIDDIGNILVSWDNGSTLSIIPEAGDQFEIVR